MNAWFENTFLASFQIGEKYISEKQCAIFEKYLKHKITKRRTFISYDTIGDLRVRTTRGTNSYYLSIVKIDKEAAARIKAEIERIDKLQDNDNLSDEEYDKNELKIRELYQELAKVE